MEETGRRAPGQPEGFKDWEGCSQAEVQKQNREGAWEGKPWKAGLIRPLSSHTPLPTFSEPVSVPLSSS